MIEAGEPRDLAALVVPRVGRLESADDPWEPWRLCDPAGAVLARRLKAKADQVWLFTRDFAVPWTSSASEQAIKGPKRHQAVSGTGMLRPPSPATAALTPQILNNCSAVFEVPGGTITTQFATFPGGAPKPIALTGGGGAYRNTGGVSERWSSSATAKGA
jgi:hypothetical protein